MTVLPCRIQDRRMKDHQKELSQDYQPVLGNTVLLGYYYKYIRTGFISKYFLYYVKD